MSVMLYKEKVCPCPGSPGFACPLFSYLTSSSFSQPFSSQELRLFASNPSLLVSLVFSWCNWKMRPKMMVFWPGKELYIMAPKANIDPIGSFICSFYNLHLPILPLTEYDWALGLITYVCDCLATPTFLVVFCLLWDFWQGNNQLSKVAMSLNGMEYQEKGATHPINIDQSGVWVRDIMSNESVSLLTNGIHSTVKYVGWNLSV